MTVNLFAILFCINGLLAQAFEIPPLVGGVNDTAAIMDSGQEQALSQALQEIHRKGGPQLAVLTVETIDPLSVEDAAIQVARKWGLGSATKDNGILLLVAKKERKVRIEVGQGVEGDLTDAYSRRIIDGVIVPMFRQGDYSGGILLGVDHILKRMNPPIFLEEYLQMEVRSPRHKKREPNWIHLLLLVCFLIAFASSRSFRNSVVSGIILGSLGGGRGRGGYGGGGGGWSGGGGGFSGGGASGSW